MRAARFAATAIGTALTSQFRLSRYPTRTAPAVPGHVHTRLWQLAAATTLPWAAEEPLPGNGQEAVGGRAGQHAERPTGQDIGGRDRWRR